jgi:UDP-GlcNAc:undecaprenyl-phosphate/decaprenyl-phosphate GlcNAc-1-phosphate transferase
MDIAFYKSSLTAFAISLIFTPILIIFSRKRGFFASVNHRSSHADSVPNTGGIILCFAVLIPLILFSDYPHQQDFSVLISAFAVLLITGIIDDFNPIPVAYKFLGQFIPAIVIVTSIDQQELVIPFINDFVHLPFIFNYLFWIFFIVLIINAFNLIDGIDGLALGMGIVGGVFYFLKFYEYGNQSLIIFSVSLVSALIGLLFYNISNRFKIFIGDTGSLMIGGMLIYFALKYIDLSGESTNNKSFFLVIGSIFIPLADMIRVTLVRILNRQSPFVADRQHIHHIILDLVGKNHLLATAILISGQTVVLIIFREIAQGYNPYFKTILIATFLIYFGLSTILNLLRKKKC